MPETLLAQLRYGGVPVPLRELLPVRAQHETVVQHLRQLAADRAGDSLLELEVGPVVTPADDMGDSELEIVRDRGQLIRRGAVRAKQRRSVTRQANRPVGISFGAPDPTAVAAASA